MPYMGVLQGGCHGRADHEQRAALAEMPFPDDERGVEGLLAGRQALGTAPNYSLKRPCKRRDAAALTALEQSRHKESFRGTETFEQTHSDAASSPIRISTPAAASEAAQSDTRGATRPSWLRAVGFWVSHLGSRAACVLQRGRGKVSPQPEQVRTSHAHRATAQRLMTFADVRLLRAECCSGCRRQLHTFALAGSYCLLHRPCVRER